MSPDQCCQPRSLLSWCQRELAAAADAPLWFVIAFEDGDAPVLLADHEVDLREALEAAGIRFDSDGVRLAAARVN